MTVRPVDMLTMLPRLTEAGRLQHVNDQRPAVLQHVMNAQGQNRTERQLKQVNQKSSAEQAGIQRDGGRRNQQPDQEQRERNKKEQEKGAPGEPGLGSRLDVKL